MRRTGAEVVGPHRDGVVEQGPPVRRRIRGEAVEEVAEQLELHAVDGGVQVDGVGDGFSRTAVGLHPMADPVEPRQRHAVDDVLGTVVAVADLQRHRVIQAAVEGPGGDVHHRFHHRRTHVVRLRVGDRLDAVDLVGHQLARSLDLDVAHRGEVLLEPLPVRGTELANRQQRLQLLSHQVVDALAAAGDELLNFGGRRSQASEPHVGVEG